MPSSAISQFPELNMFPFRVAYKWWGQTKQSLRSFKTNDLVYPLPFSRCPWDSYRRFFPKHGRRTSLCPMPGSLLQVELISYQGLMWGKKEFHSHVIFVKNTFPYKHIHLSWCLRWKLLLLTVSWRVQRASFSSIHLAQEWGFWNPIGLLNFVVLGCMYLPF